MGETLLRKGSEEHNKPPQSTARGSAQALLHPSELLLRKFCVHTGQIRVFLLSCIHSHSSDFSSHHVDVPLASCGHCPAKIASPVGSPSPPKLYFLWRVCAHVGIEFQALVHERWELFPLERRTWSCLSLKTPFPRKGPCLLSWGRVKKQKHEPSFLLPWSIWPWLWEKLSDSSSLSCQYH